MHHSLEIYLLQKKFCRLSNRKRFSLNQIDTTCMCHQTAKHSLPPKKSHETKKGRIITTHINKKVRIET